jgi:hypothetical protein
MNEPGTHKLSEAVKPPQANSNPSSAQAGPPEPLGPDSTPAEVAEQARREQEARLHAQPDRDDYMTQVGRGQQTHG